MSARGRRLQLAWTAMFMLCVSCYAQSANVNTDASTKSLYQSSRYVDLGPLTDDGDLARFGEDVQILGKAIQMQRTDQDFTDGLALDLFSPRPRTVRVVQNFQPLPAVFMIGSSGGSFIALSNYSYVVKLNETASDLIAKIELPYDPTALRSLGVEPANTFVGQLSPDRSSWIIDESKRNVHVSENKTRIIRMVSLDGEYLLLGRRSIDFANIFVQYGYGATRTVNFTGGQGIQEAEFVDGLRWTVQSDRPMQMNVDLRYGVMQRNLPQDTLSLCKTGAKTLTESLLLNVVLDPYSWVVNTSSLDTHVGKASASFPLNRPLIPPALKVDDFDFVLARRDGTAGQDSKFQVLVGRSALESGCSSQTDALKIRIDRLDGEYVVLLQHGRRKTN